MPKFHIKPTYIVKAENETAALAKFYKARAHRREDVYLSAIKIDESEERDWLIPKAYKPSGFEEEEEDE